MSDARMFLALLVERGVTASLIGGRVKLSGAERLSPATIEAARTMRDDIIALLAKPIGKTGHDCCVCGEPAGLGEGWTLRGPGGAKLCCSTCVPGREEIVSVACGIGEPSLPAEGPARLDWWRQPVEGWASGRLEIHNMLTGVTTVIDLRSK